MISDLDIIMQKHSLSAVLVYGETSLCDPELTYVARVSLARGGLFFKPRSQKPTLVVGNLDVGTARQGRVSQIKTCSDYGFLQILQRYGRGEAYARLIDKILKRAKIKGRIALYGRNETATATALVDSLRRLGHNIVGERPPTVFGEARSTKDDWELDQLRDVGRRTSSIVEATIEFLRRCRRKGGLLQWKGRPMTIGSVRARINQLLSTEGLIAPEGVIFAQGKSSADPHQRGHDAERIRTGRVIVFDLFPQNSSGYWFDVTRSFVIGSAPKKIRRIFDTVLDAHTGAVEKARAGVACKELMSRACDTVERAGFLSLRDELKGSKEARFRGFNHSLGHGVGLTIGEAPLLSLFSNEWLKPRNVVTIEPGIYEPKLGGVRIEDTVFIRSGRPENPTNVTKELEI